MQFYKFEGLIKNEKWSKENENRRVLCEKIRKISVKTAVFNQRLWHVRQKRKKRGMLEAEDSQSQCGRHIHCL